MLEGVLRGLWSGRRCGVRAGAPGVAGRHPGGRHRVERTCSGRHRREDPASRPARSRPLPLRTSPLERADADADTAPAPAPPRNAENPPGHCCPDGFSSVCQIEDSNFCRREPADLQSAPFGRSGNLANFSTTRVVRYTLYYDTPSNPQIGCSGRLIPANRRGGSCSRPAGAARRWRHSRAGGRSGPRRRRSSGGRRQAHADAPGSVPGAPGPARRPCPR